MFEFLATYFLFSFSFILLLVFHSAYLFNVCTIFLAGNAMVTVINKSHNVNGSILLMKKRSVFQS